MKLAVCALLIVGCGPKAPTGTAEPIANSTGDTPFDALDQDQRIEFMKTVVVPTMKPLFTKHDSAKFRAFGCETCHGKGAGTGDYSMPNSELPKLNLADLTMFKKEDLEWMQQVVKPTMANLLKQAEYSPQNTHGFGCLSCHTPIEAGGR